MTARILFFPVRGERVLEFAFEVGLEVLDDDDDDDPEEATRSSTTTEEEDVRLLNRGEYAGRLVIKPAPEAGEVDKL
jgi:hypothetical protein